MREGEESQAFEFTRHGLGFVARIGPSGEAFRKEALAHAKFNSPGVPVPEVVAIAPIGGELFLCVSRRAAGVTLEDLDAGSLRRIAGPVADLMNSIAASPVDWMCGFGVFDASGNASDVSWRGFLSGIADRARYDWSYAERAGVDLREIEPLLDRLCELSTFCPETRQLIHGDFGSNNVLTNRDGITAAVDWSEAAIGDGLYDVANVFFWRTWLLCMEIQAQHLETRLSTLPNWRERLLCYQLRIGLAEIFGNAVLNRPGRAAWALQRCREIARD